MSSKEHIIETGKNTTNLFVEIIYRFTLEPRKKELFHWVSGAYPSSTVDIYHVEMFLYFKYIMTLPKASLVYENVSLLTKLAPHPNKMYYIHCRMDKIYCYVWMYGLFKFKTFTYILSVPHFSLNIFWSTIYLFDTFNKLYI